ncbi:ABC transporter ATP-binding protein [Candidatus Hepatincolaceae symbiont of Richtersius coronifer]
MPHNSIIKIENLSKSFGLNKVLDKINLEVNKGDSIAIIGQSGTGKSVLIKNIIGVMKPDFGKIYIEGEEITKLTQNQRIKKSYGIGLLFQGSALFDSLTIKENVVFGLAIHKKISSVEAHRIALENLELVGLDASVLNLYPAELSGGMQKRVALARLIVLKSKILFFDEPTSGLDPVMSNIIGDVILDVVKYLGATAITITHEMKIATKLAHKIIMLDSGKIAWQGHPQDIYNPNNKLIYNFTHGLTYTN